MQRLMKAGGYIQAFDVKDRFVAYGLVGCFIIQDNRIEQFVMSCRVIGMDVEFTALANVMKSLRRNGVVNVTAAAVETAANLLSRDIFAKSGFTETQPGQWHVTLNAPAEPAE